jgi:hypothetical protein
MMDMLNAATTVQPDAEEGIAVVPERKREPNL